MGIPSNDCFVQKITISNLIIICLLLVTAFSSPLYSQERCATVPYMEKLKKEGKVKQTEEQFEKWLAQRIRNRQQQIQTQRTEGGPYEIPVVVHVIHNNEPIGTGPNISDNQILSQIDVLNKDFKRLNSDASLTPAQFLPVAASMDVTFVMARRDPNGNFTAGINRVVGTRSSWTMNNDAEFKALSYWPSEDYLNIWVIKFSGNFIGYAQFPVSNLQGLEPYQDGIAATDGIVIDYTTFGSIDGGPFILDPDYNKGRTTTHEVGHFFGLRHTWGDVDNCSGTDYVSDTPNQTTSTIGCPSHPQSSCTTTKMFQNYLDYTDDACMNLFTQGQVSRMMTILDDASVPRRKSLLTSPGLLNPNCSRTDVALVKVESPGAVTCDQNVEFKISIRNRGCAPVISVTINYSINLGAPQTNIVSLSTPLNINNVASLIIPSVTFQEGVNVFSFSITHANGSPDEDLPNGTLQSNFLVDKSMDRIPLREKFDVLNWARISPQSGINWSLKGTTFANSASVQAFNQGTVGTEAWLVSPVLDLSTATKASVFFDLSYAYNGTDFDRLRILSSTDCGNTYDELTLFDESGSNLANTNSTASWLPTTSSQWQLNKYINLTAFAGKENVRLAFVFTNARGNNIYLDNIEFFLSDNPDPVNVGNDLYSVYWSSANQASVTFNLADRMPVRIQVVDIMGRTYVDTLAPDILNQTFPIELGNASTGIYLLRVQIGAQYYVTKFFLSR